jgi:hypothetical protein
VSSIKFHSTTKIFFELIVTGEVFYKFLFLGAVEMQKNLIYCLEEKSYVL